jgi:hypothetical protein
MNWTQTIERYIAEGRTVSGGKGDSQLKQQETAQANFTNQLMGTFNTQFQNQSNILSFLNSKMQPLINNPQGFSPSALAAMRTQATEGTATDFSNAQKATNAAIAARGGNGLPSGVDAQLTAQNANAGAAENAGAQNQITLANEQQKQNNYWNAVNAENGIQAAYNPLGYAGGAQNGGSVVSGLGSAYKQSQQSQWLGALGGLAGGALSAAGQAGGFGSLFGH